jgi:Rrf2 family protein
MLTNKGKYGLKALIDLANKPYGESYQVSDIALRNNISKKFLDTILLDLKNAGFVQSKKGPGGGYALAKRPGDIKIGAIIRALDGPIAPIACANRTAFRPCDDCKDFDSCAVRLIMTDVRNAMAGILDSTTLSDLAVRSNSVDVIDYAI